MCLRRLALLTARTAMSEAASADDQAALQNVLQVGHFEQLSSVHHSC